MKKGILLPAYNEEKSIGKVIKKCKKHVPDAEIVVVDDGSKDRTGEIARSLGVTVISHDINKGKGEAIKSGLEYFRKIGVDTVVILDADGQYAAKDANKFFKILGKYDFVMGFRDFSSIPFRHKLGNILWKTVFNFLFGTRFKDTNCGYIGLSKNAMQKLTRIHGGYIIENSLLSEAIEKNLRIAQVYVNVKYRKTSGIIRGIRMVLGVLLFIILEGIRYRLKKFFK